MPNYASCPAACSWDGGTTFATLYAKVPAAIRFHLPDYFMSRPLCAAAEAAGKEVMGRNEAGDCVFLNDDPPPPSHDYYECLNDGTCAAIRTASAAARPSSYATKDSCELYCNSGWRCQQNADTAGAAGANAMMCVPDPFHGDCSTIDACENACVPADADH